jgi:general stress protein 26
MTQEYVVKFISDHRFMVISTKTDDFPESANVEFGNDGLALIFDTNRDSRKFQNIQKDPRVSVVIGWDEDVNKTVQYQGIAEEAKGEELSRLKKYILPKVQMLKNGKIPKVTYTSK